MANEIQRFIEIENILCEKNTITDSDLNFLIEKYEEYEQFAKHMKDSPLVFYIRAKLDSLYGCREYRLGWESTKVSAKLDMDELNAE